MRIVNQVNAPGVMAPAHFLPQFDDAKCNFCGKCAGKCPMGALVVDPGKKLRSHRQQRCIGCGLCAVACTQRGAVAMEPVPHYRLPYQSWFSLLFHAGPGMLHSAWHAWKSR
jgi:MinD superfamily P-loop ATPase